MKDGDRCPECGGYLGEAPFEPCKTHSEHEIKQRERGVPLAFKLGDIVETTKGAEFWGEIIAFDNDAQSPGCTVKAFAPGFVGTKHVYPLKQLRRTTTLEKMVTKQ